METGTKLIEELIAAVLDDFREKGFSSVMPFSIGSVEIRMSQFADANGIELASEELYMSAKQLQHSMRASKNVKGLVVEASELISFPESRFSRICITMASVSFILMGSRNLLSIPTTK